MATKQDSSLQKVCGDLLNRIYCPPAEAIYFDDAKQVRVHGFNEFDLAEIEVAESEVDRFPLRRGDILMNEGGDNDKLGRGAVWQGGVEPCLHQNHVFAVRPEQESYSSWTGWVIQSMYAKFYFYMKASQSGFHLSNQLENDSHNLA